VHERLIELLLLPEKLHPPISIVLDPAPIIPFVVELMMVLRMPVLALSEIDIAVFINRSELPINVVNEFDPVIVIPVLAATLPLKGPEKMQSVILARELLNEMPVVLPCSPTMLNRSTGSPVEPLHLIPVKN